MNVTAARMRLNQISKELLTKSANGSITEAQIDAYQTEAADLTASIKATKQAQSMSHMADLRPGIGSRRTDSTLDSGKRLSFKGIAEPLSRKIVGDDGTGVKTLAPSGAAVVDQQFMADPIALGKIATGLLDVLPVQPQPTSTFAYLRQGTRTNNAATVADFGTKPTSVYEVTRIEQTLDVIAHLSQGTPRYWFMDNNTLQGFLSNEMAYGLQLAVEAKVFTDIAATTGTQTQAYSTSPLATLRKSLTKLEVAGWEPSALVLHPTDWEAVELALATTNAVEYLSLPYDAATRRLFGVPVVTTVSATAGMAHALARDAVVVATDNNGISLQWSETSNATDFQENLVRARVEGRFQTLVYRPGGVVVADLTEGS